MTDVDGFVRDYSGEGRGDFGVSEIEPGSLELRQHLIDGLFGAFELRLRLFDADLEIARVETEQQVAFFNGPVVLNIDVGDGAGNARRNQRDSTVHVGVVGGDVVTVVAEI